MTLTYYNVVIKYNLTHIIDPELPGIYKLTDPTRTMFFCFDSDPSEEEDEIMVDIMINKEGIYDPEKKTVNYNSDDIALVTFRVFCSDEETPGLINEYMSELPKYVGMERLLILEKLNKIHYPKAIPIKAAGI